MHCKILYHVMIYMKIEIGVIIQIIYKNNAYYLINKNEYIQQSNYYKRDMVKVL